MLSAAPTDPLRIEKPRFPRNPTYCCACFALISLPVSQSLLMTVLSSLTREGLFKRLNYQNSCEFMSTLRVAL